MQSELRTLEDKNTWELAQSPSDKNLMKRKLGLQNQNATESYADVTKTLSKTKLFTLFHVARAFRYIQVIN